MQNITILLLKSLFVSGLMLGYYLLVLRNKKLHTFNRFYLLATVVASLIIPFLHFDWYTIKETSSTGAITMLQVLNTGGGEEEMTPIATQSVTASDVAMWLYTLVSVLLLAILVTKVAWVYRQKRKYKVTQAGGYDLVHTNLEKAPFSFLNNVFWNDAIDIESETGRQVLEHELAHIRQLHSLDKLLIQLVLVVCWINPFHWYIQKELSLVHEFLADDKAIKNNDTSSFAKMLLASHYKGSLQTIVNPFFYSSVKRRIVMLNQTNKTSFALLRRAMVLPLVLIPMLLFSFTVHESPTGTNNVAINKAATKMTLILDAGHGGSDEGGTGISGVVEKDLTLTICKTIAALAKEHNIDVVMTRGDDSYPTLAQRVEKANAVKNAVFISIHVNKSTEGVPPFNGCEVMVSGKNQKFAESKLFASAVMGQIKQAGRQTQLTEKGLHVLKENRHPSILIECGNLDDMADVSMLEDKNKREALCRNLLNGVVAFGNTQKQ